MNKRWPIALASAAAMALIAYGLWIQRSAPRIAGEATIEVKVVAAKKVSAPSVIQAMGEFQAVKETDVVSKVPGVIKEIRKIGDSVKTGQVVALIESKPLAEHLRMNETAVKAAAATLQEVKGRLEQTEKKLADAREAYAKELIARRDLEEMGTAAETARAENERARAQLAQSEAALAQARYLMTLTRVMAPASGIVTRRFAQRGAPAPAILMSIADVSIMRVAVKLLADDAAAVDRGIGATVTASVLPKKVFTGSVTRVTAAGEGEADKKSTVEILVRNADGALKPGMEGLVSLPLKIRREIILIPQAAVFDLQRKPCVYVVERNKARLRKITTGREISGEIVVTSALAEGEKVVVAGQDKIRPDSIVQMVK